MRSSVSTISRALVFPCVVALIACLAQPAAAVPCTALVTPIPGEVMDNGCFNGSDPIHWEFDWTDCPGATAYHLYVKHPSAMFALIDDYTLVSSGYVFDAPGSYTSNLFDWRWRVQAFVSGQWDEWTEERSFNVEQIGTDCSPTTAEETTWGELKSLFR